MLLCRETPLRPEAENKEKKEVLHLTKKKAPKTINIMQFYLLPWEQGVSCSERQVKLGLKEE